MEDTLLVAAFRDGKLISDRLDVTLSSEDVTRFDIPGICGVVKTLALVTADGTEITFTLTAPEIVWESEKVSLEDMNLSGKTLTVCLRNTSDEDIIVDAVYKDGLKSAEDINILIRGNDTVCSPLPGMYYKGEYVMIATRDGERIVFRAGLGKGEHGIRMENWYITDEELIVCIRNTTYHYIVVAAAYQNGRLISDRLNKVIHGGCVVCFMLYGTFTEGDTLMFVTVDGTEIISTLSRPEELWESEGIILQKIQLSGDTLTVCIRNTTDAEIFVDAVYQNSILLLDVRWAIIPANDVICFSLFGTFSVGDTVMLVTQDGIKIIFIVQ